ncbi:MAG: dihydropteroate synthase [Lachnospiraceae bacterium]|nr:dihydropteroate synthase [Lachnospiraceae bacterium]
MQIGNRVFDLNNGKTYIAGILNLTPDSFSDGGKALEKGVIAAALALEEDGADMLDVGAESTRPGARFIPEPEERERLLPALLELKKRITIPISVDTYKAEIAAAALDAGADMINDVHGLRTPDLKDSGMAKVIAEYRVPVVIMHNDFLSRDPSERTAAQLEAAGVIPGTDIVQRVTEGLSAGIAIAKAAGVEEDQIALDPGIGFGKSHEEELELLKRLKLLSGLGCPLYLGTSRKSLIGDVLDLPVDQREEGTLVTTILAAQAGCSFVRVHDVRANRRALDMLTAIREA